MVPFMTCKPSVACAFLKKVIMTKWGHKNKWNKITKDLKNRRHCNYARHVAYWKQLWKQSRAECMCHMYTPLTKHTLSYSLPVCVCLSLSFCMCGEVHRAGVPLSLKEAALTSMTFFSCLARHHTPAHERALAPKTGELWRKAGLDSSNLGHRLLLPCQQGNPNQNIWGFVQIH